MLAKLTQRLDAFGRNLAIGLSAFAALPLIQAELISGQDLLRNEIQGVATFIDGTYGRQYNSDSRVGAAVKFDYENKSPANHGLRISESLYRRQFAFATSSGTASLLIGSGKTLNTGRFTSSVAYQTDWMIATIDVSIDLNYEGKFNDEFAVSGGSRLLLLVLRNREVDEEGLDYLLPDIKAGLPDVIRKFRATLCNRALNDIGQEPWRSALELSDDQIRKVYEESSRWYAETGNQIVAKLAGNKDEDEAKKLWQKWHHEQWKIASGILIPFQQKQLIRLHNQSELNLDSIQEGVAFWLANPTLFDALDLPEKKRERLSKLDEQLRTELDERLAIIDSKMESVDEESQRVLYEMLSNSEKETFDSLTGKPLKFDEEEWIAATKQARANHLQNQAMETFMDGYSGGGGIAGGYTSKSSEVSTQLSLPVWGLAKKFDPKLVRTLTSLEFARKDLEFTDEQRMALKTNVSQFKQLWKERLENREATDYKARREEFRRKLKQNELEFHEVFPEHQQARMLQIINQMSFKVFGHQPALTNPEWPSRLGLSGDRTRRFNAAANEIKAARLKLVAGHEKSLDKIRAKYEKRMKQVCDRSDNEKMESMLGDPVFLPTFVDTATSDAGKEETTAEAAGEK